MKVVLEIFIKIFFVIYFIVPLVVMILLLMRSEPVVKGITAYNLTDKNWKNGVWTASDNAIFFIGIEKRYSRNIKVGDNLVFNKSGRRKVVEVNDSDQYVNIRVDGPKLSPDGDGYPNIINKVD